MDASDVDKCASRLMASSNTTYDSIFESLGICEDGIYSTSECFYHWLVSIANGTPINWKFNDESGKNIRKFEFTKINEVYFISETDFRSVSEDIVKEIDNDMDAITSEGDYWSEGDEEAEMRHTRAQDRRDNGSARFDELKRTQREWCRDEDFFVPMFIIICKYDDVFMYLVIGDSESSKTNIRCHICGTLNDLVFRAVPRVLRKKIASSK